MAITDVRFFFEFGMGWLSCLEVTSEERVALDTNWSCFALALIAFTSPDDPLEKK